MVSAPEICKTNDLACVIEVKERRENELKEVFTEKMAKSFLKLMNYVN